MRPATDSLQLPFHEEAVEALTRALPDLLYRRRWFGSKARRIGAVGIIDSIPIPCGSLGVLLLIRVEYDDGGIETYTLPVMAAMGQEAELVQRDRPQAILAPLTIRKDNRDQRGVLYDALWNREFALALLQTIGRGSRCEGCIGSLIASPTKIFGAFAPTETGWEPTVMQAEQSNTSVAFGGRVILKLFRRLEQGMSPDLEIGRMLTDRQFPYVPPIAGALEYQDDSGSLATLGVLQKYVVNEGDAWRYSLQAVEGFVERTVREYPGERPPGNRPRLLDSAREEYSPLARQLIGEYLESAERLGRRTAQLHEALSQVVDDPAFGPEPLTPEYRQAQYESMMRGMAGTLTLLKERMDSLPLPCQADACVLLELEPVLQRIIDDFGQMAAAVLRIRCHGDYHLGQVLWTGSDFMIIDFEGEPTRSLAERRMKHPALVDIAGMVRSFHYAPIVFMKEKGLERSRWASFWSDWASTAFVKGYLRMAAGAPFWPQDAEVVGLLLDVYVVQKALYELRYELNNRPDWVDIPLHGLVELLKIRAENKP